MIGWRRFGQAQPNDAHLALARLEARGRSRMLLTQNGDRLHQAAGSREVSAPSTPRRCGDPDEAGRGRDLDDGASGRGVDRRLQPDPFINIKFHGSPFAKGARGEQ
jgi:hypothetical protein